MPSVPTATSPYPQPGGYVPPGRTGALDRDAFLRLLVTQLSNQDPLNPQQGHEFAAQLAQFSSVEQLTAMGETLAAQAQLLAGIANGLGESSARQEVLGTQLTQRTEMALASGLIGRDVETAGAALPWDGATPPGFAFTLAQPAASVRVQVRSESGQVVRTIELGHAGRGHHGHAWDGLDDDGQPLPAGTYSFSVDARAADGARLGVTTFSRGRVDRVSVEAGRVTLWIGGRAVPLADVRGLVS
ncbi:MAG: flagellar hook assembly protein FlgD [Rubricoccaceae bacterium]